MSRDICFLKTSLLYGRSINTRDSLFAGTVFGIAGYLLFESGLCSAGIPEIPLCFITMLVIPFLFFFLAKPPLFDVLNPRREGVSFIAGIPYGERRNLFFFEVLKINRQILFFVFVSWTINFLLNLVFHHEKHQAWTTIPALASVLETMVLSFGTSVLVKNGIIRASRKDATEWSGDSISSLRYFLIKTTGALSEIIVSPLRGRIRVIAKRQITDLFRADTVNSILTLPFLILIAILLKLLLKDATEQILQMVFIIGAYGIVLLNSSSLLDSSLAFSRLPFYGFSFRELFLGNCYLFLALTILFPITYFICVFFDSPRALNAMNLLQFLGSYLYLILISGAWHTQSSIPKRNRLPQNLLYSYLIAAMLSLFIPLYGLVFPGSLCLLLLIAENCLFSKDLFHNKVRETEYR